MANKTPCPLCGKNKFEFLIIVRPDKVESCDSCWIEKVRVVKSLAGKKTSVSLNDIRARRNRLLLETDFWEMPSVRHKNSKAKNTKRDKFRQKLRDLTDFSGDPKNIEMPKKPK